MEKKIKAKLDIFFCGENKNGGTNVDENGEFNIV